MNISRPITREVLIPGGVGGDRREPPALESGYDGFAWEPADAKPRPLVDYLFIIWKYRWLCVTAFALVLGAALTLTVVLPKQFRAATKISISSERPIQLKFTENVLTDGPGDRVINGASIFTATQVAILKSRDLADRVIRSHRLTEAPVFLEPAKAGRAGLFAAVGSLAAVFRPRGWKPVGAQQGAGEGASIEVPIELIDRYMDYLDVREVRGTDLIEVSFTTPSPDLSAFLASAHVQAYKEATDEARLATEVTARDFLERHVREAQQRREAAEAALNDFATRHASVTINREEKIVARGMAELSSRLTAAQAERVALESRHQFLTRPGSLPVSYFLSQPTIEKIRFALLEVAAERASLGDRLGPNHPRMRELAVQQAALETRLDAEVQKEVGSVEAHLHAATLNEASLKAQLAEQERGTVDLRDMETTYNLLFGEVESSRALYESLLKRQKETVVNSELTANNIWIVERAEVPAEPSSPNVLLNVIVGCFCGGLVALATAVLCENLDKSIKNGDEVEALLQLPTLATVPSFRLAESAPARRVHPTEEPAPGAGRNGDCPQMPDLVVFHDPSSAASEAFRVMRTAILYSAPPGFPQVILVTSSRAGEGKTVTTLNLAAALGLSGARVLVIDTDLRRPGCHWMLGHERNVPGLSTYLSGQVELEEILRSVDSVANVACLPAGPTPPNPAELLGSVRMRAALAWARERYDFILLDSAPALPVTDPVVLAREADGVLFVIKGQDTPREVVRRGRNQLLSGGARFLGVVVNNVDDGANDYHAYSDLFTARFNGGSGSLAASPAEARA